MAWVTKNTGIAKRSGYFYGGREIALSQQDGRPLKTKRNNQEWWPESKKIEAATVYTVTRNFDKTKELTGVPRYVLKKWADQAWWVETMNKVVKGRNDALDAKITEVLDKTVDLISDRLDNGETHYNHKTETTYKLPLKAKEAAQVTSVLFDKRQLIRGEATSRTESVSSEQKLLALKENFEKLARSKLINPGSEPIEGEVNAGSNRESLEETGDEEAIEGEESSSLRIRDVTEDGLETEEGAINAVE